MRAGLPCIATRCCIQMLVCIAGLYSGMVAAELQISVQADRTRAFVNQQILLTVQVEAPADAFSVTGDKLEIVDARLQPVDRAERQRAVDGESYQQTTTVYALFVPTPGTVRVPALTYRARLPVPLLEDGTRASGGNPRISASSEALAIEIEPAPADERVWFAASEVKIESAWQQTAGEMIVGEPFVREITVSASGQYAAAIPPIDIPVDASLRSYPSIANYTESEDASGLTGRQRQSITYLATQAGSVELPAWTLDWWDTNEQIWRVAHAPAETIEVQAAANAGLSHWYPRLLGALALLSALLLITVIVLWRRLRSLRSATTAKTSANCEAQRWRQMRRRLRTSSAADIRAAILAWASARQPGIVRLEELAIEHPDLAPVLQRLDAVLYGASDGSLSVADRRDLALALKRVRRRRRPRGAPAALPALYPQS